MTGAAKQYNYCLDFFKGIACMFVVFMHCEFPGVTGIAVQAISRFCVPFFFMVSGYYCFRLSPQLDGAQYVNVAGEAIIKKKALRIAKITLYASLFYLVFVLLRQAFFHNQDLSVNKAKIVSWLVFNQPFIVLVTCGFSLLYYMLISFTAY